MSPARRWVPLVIVALLLVGILAGWAWSAHSDSQHARDDVCDLRPTC